MLEVTCSSSSTFCAADARSTAAAPGSAACTLHEEMKRNVAVQEVLAIAQPRGCLTLMQGAALAAVLVTFSCLLVRMLCSQHLT